MRAYLTLLKVPALRRLLLASIPADLADWLDYVAVVALLAYVWNQGPFILAAFAVALAVPYVVIGPLAGALVDRLDLRFVLVGSNAGRALLTAAFIFAPNPAVALLLVFIRAAIDSAFTPARQAALQAVAAPEQLAAANGAVQGINQASKIVGPALGGLLMALLPLTAVFAVNTAFSLAAAAILLGLALPRRPAVAHPPFLGSGLLEGWREYLRNRRLAGVLGFVAGASFCFFLYDTIIALLIEAFGYGRTEFGISVAASGAGGLVGALIAGAIEQRRPLRIMSVAAFISAPVTVALASAVLIGVAVPQPLLYLAMALMGGSTAFMLVPYRTLVQREVAPERIGRVFAAGEAVNMAVMLTAPFLGSLLAGAFGVPVPFLAGAALYFLLGVLAFALGGR